MQVSRSVMMAAMSVAVATSLGWTQQAGSEPDLDAEIARVRKEMTQVALERQRNQQSADKDRRDFEEYRSRTAKRMSQVQSETDSLARQISALGQRGDSLAALVSLAQTQRRQIELSQDNLRQRVASSCDDISASLGPRLAPMVSRQVMTSLALVRSELTSKAIDNVEGMNRLATVCGQAEETASSIQIAQETSPVPEVRGMAYRIRIGHLFEGIVDMKKEACAVWDGNGPDGAPIWRSSSDATLASQIYLAATVREGKALPSFVSLPLGARTAQGGAR